MASQVKRQKTELPDGAKAAENYYDNSDADNFYYQIWGGTDIHVGIYGADLSKETILKGSERTVDTIARMLIKKPTETTKVLDLGAGYGGAARALVKKFNCFVDCLNISEVQNTRNREMNKEQGISDKIKVVYGSFEEIPMKDNCYDVIWSEDSFLHSSSRDKIISECARVLKPGGQLIFTDLMRTDKDIPNEILEPILKRIALPSIGSVDAYRKYAENAGLLPEFFFELQHQIPRHYAKVLEELEANQVTLSKVCSKKYLENMKAGLKHWIRAGRERYMTWGILLFTKPELQK